jgi:hypothetical protein
MPTITGSVEDREQIRELYARYAIYLDSSKFEEWVNCFTEDGIFESPPVGKHAGHATPRKFCASLREKWAGAQVRPFGLGNRPARICRYCGRQSSAL